MGVATGVASDITSAGAGAVIGPLASLLGGDQVETLKATLMISGGVVRTPRFLDAYAGSTLTDESAAVFSRTTECYLFHKSPRNFLWLDNTSTSRDIHICASSLQTAYYRFLGYEAERARRPGIQQRFGMYADCDGFAEIPAIQCHYCGLGGTLLGYCRINSLRFRVKQCQTPSRHGSSGPHDRAPDLILYHKW